MRINIYITDEEWHAVMNLAEQELRHTKEQIHFFVREGLIKRGLIPDPYPSASPDDTQR